MKKINSKKYVWIIIIAILFAFLYFLGFLKPLENIFTKILNPISGGFYSLSSNLRVTYNEQASKKDLWKRVKDLEEDANLLAAENAKLKTIEEDNRILRQHLNFLAKNNHQYVLANVISREDIDGLAGRSEIIIIDKGKNNGLYPGLGVLNSQGIIVGKIFKTKENISKVYLTNSRWCKLAAMVLDREMAKGIAEGELGLTIKMGFISQEKEIKIDDMIITSGLEQAIPRGLVIGRIKKVSKEGNELWQSAVIEPLVNLDELIIVSVLLPL